MPLTGEEIRGNLLEFAARWAGYSGTERAGAQPFLEELFHAYGVDRKDVGAEFELHQDQGGFVDLIWPGRCLFEMKAPTEVKRLSKHRAQARRYWEHAADQVRRVPAPTYVVLCAFHSFEVWDFGHYPREPRTTFTLAELPDRYDALLFLVGEQPVFTSNHADVTRDATAKIVALHDSLKERREGGPDARRDFILQVVWCMFAEDVAQIPNHRFTAVIDGLLAEPQRSSADELGRLFDLLAAQPAQRPRPPRGVFADIPYANGGLFETPVALELTSDELALLREVADFNWSAVDPAIVGSLLQGTLGRQRQWELGAHWTPEALIRTIVEPTIVAPWRERIASLDTLAEARSAERDLLNYVVLDPACGSGNFLTIAYRELRGIEQALRERTQELALAAGHGDEQQSLSFFPITNIRGIEIDTFAVRLARVTLWMGHKLATLEYGLDERTLPLADLSGVTQGDALRVPWPRADAIIGNPPYFGSQSLRRQIGEEQVDWLIREFDCGVKDYCVYWFRKAVDHMGPDARAGLVGTNSIRQNKGRSASLNYVVERGGVITDAVSSEKWPEDAVVEVSIVNWVKQPSEPPRAFRLDAQEVAGINTRLRESLMPIEEYERLPANRGRSFQGAIPGGKFVLDDSLEIEALLARDDARYREVVRPYLIGDDIAEDPEQRPRRYAIDFDYWPLERAMEYPAALEIVRDRVKPERDASDDEELRRCWWRFRRPRRDMRLALKPLARFIVANAQGKRFLFTWQERDVLPSNLTNVFAFDDDYAMGILTSSIHMAWADHEMSTLRVDRRYTPTTCFETFPWPSPTSRQRDEVRQAVADLLTRRAAICVERGIGLTTLYNQVDEGAWQDLAQLHQALDHAVARSYGWDPRIAERPLEARLLLAERHAEIVAGQVEYTPFAGWM